MVNIYVYIHNVMGGRSLIRKFAVPSLVLIFFFFSFFTDGETDIINRDDIIDTKIAELTS